jgi:hypothetical protein
MRTKIARTPGSTRPAALHLLALVGTGLLLVACGSGDGDAGAATATVTVTQTVTLDADPTGPSSDTSAEETEPGEDTDPTFENDVLTTSDLRIEITSHKVIKPGDKGNEYSDKAVIAFYYSTTNLSGADVDPMSFLFNFEAYQDNNPDAVNSLEVGSLPDERFLESQSETIKKGGTVESAIAYELDDLTTPVDLVATEGMGEELGRATFRLR